MLKSIYNLLRYFRFYYKLFQDFRRTERYYSELLEEIKPFFPNWNQLIDSENQKRMRDYVRIQTMWTAGFCLLRGDRIQDNELKAIVNISALAPLYDDFFDKVNLPGQKIQSLVNHPLTYVAETEIERLFSEFSSRIQKYVQDIPLYLTQAQRVFEAQLESKRLVSTKPLPWKEIKRIGFEKGASTVLCMCNMLNKKPTKEEEVFLYQLGGVAQYLDDLFDVREDFLEGRQTLANPIVAVVSKKKSFKKEVLLFKKLLASANYKESHKKAFLFPVNYIIAATFLTLERYEVLEERTKGVFEIEQYSRKELVVDMDLYSNRWKAFKWSSNL